LKTFAASTVNCRSKPSEREQISVMRGLVIKQPDTT